jgi:hypothetical protein
MASTQKANPADRFRAPASVKQWHLNRRVLRGRQKPDTAETAETVLQAFRLDVSKPYGVDKSKVPPGGKGSS